MDHELPPWLDEPDDDIEEWEVVTTDTGSSSHVVFLSPREADRDRETFIVAEDSAVCDLLERR
jgi:hypothetical protein